MHWSPQVCQAMAAKHFAAADAQQGQEAATSTAWHHWGRHLGHPTHEQAAIHPAAQLFLSEGKQAHFAAPCRTVISSMLGIAIYCSSRACNAAATKLMLRGTEV